ncbi:dimethylmenaquinone methyltransferase [Methylobacterium sp. GXS13]|uniref:RraA family protein n=1 Tax=Methylobacterium sp. GXS13 TaxID=1730094 RepID=UPI00071B840D|nr:RraA family protein [Methylobacterium sp. GXS13]KST58778.1 dimethylmenaquinone methyltransferase [Methylobacterium sp. GXS13]
MPAVTHNPPPPAVDPDVLSAFEDVSTATISDCLDRMPVLLGLRAFHRRGRLLGTAFTVRVRAGDNLAIHQALEQVRRGDVIVVDGGGDTSRALVGDIMKAIAESRGVAGFVIDGAVRDTDAFAASDFPCYGRAATPRGPFKTGPGAINVPVSIGGWTVNPGDVVVGDADGVVTFPPALASRLIEAVRAQAAREAEVLALIRAGQYDGRYAREAKG